MLQVKTVYWDNLKVKCGELFKLHTARCQLPADERDELDYQNQQAEQLRCHMSTAMCY